MSRTLCSARWFDYEDQPILFIFSVSEAARIPMDILKKQFEEKKRKLEEAKGKISCRFALKLFSTISLASVAKKYLTKADLDREREAKYLEEQKRLAVCELK